MRLGSPCPTSNIPPFSPRDHPRPTTDQPFALPVGGIPELLVAANSAPIGRMGFSASTSDDDVIGGNAGLLLNPLPDITGVTVFQQIRCHDGGGGYTVIHHRGTHKDMVMHTLKWGTPQVGEPSQVLLQQPELQRNT